MEKITINHFPLQVKEYNGQRVVTFMDIDAVHNRPKGTARRNFNKNKEYFIKNEDFFVVNQPNEIRTLGIIRPQGGTPSSVILLTETGYLMLVKSFTDDLAWSVQRQLVNSYFRLKDISYKQLSFEDEPKYEYFDKTYNGKPVLTVRDISHLTGAKRQKVLWHLTNKCVRNTDYFVLRAGKMDSFKKENPKFSKMTACLTVVEKSGFLKICKSMNIECDVPNCYCIEKKKKPSNEIVAKILKDLGINTHKLSKYVGDILLDESTTITGNSVLLHCSKDKGGDRIFFDSSSGKYEKLAVIMQNIGYLLLGGFRESIDGKPVLRDEIHNEAKIFSAVFLALKMFADYGGFDTDK